MSELVLDQKVHVVSSGDRPLQLAANFWFITAVFGQWLFASYLMLFYGCTAARGELHLWKEKLTHGYVPGDSVGNTAVAAHLLLAVIVMLLGSLQLIPQIRILVLECYFRAQDSASARAKIALSAVLVILTLAMAMGIFGAWMGLWLPNLK